jgi:uncharacterized protein (DUF1697 family)
MTTWVGLLRGINVGKAKRVAMADLRALVEEAGYSKARTLLNSGNVVFQGPRAHADKVAARLEKAIEARVGFHSHVVVLDAAAIDAVVREHTLTQADNPSRLLIVFMQDVAKLKALDPLAARDWSPEAMAVGTRAAYVWSPAGVLDSAVFDAVARALGTQVTTRNWATVQKLHAMMHA